ncbi:MAG: hypothetical protein F4Z04_10970 [Acidobacteria bacterium]|nr:hypothetical protein [Acidobacteriota bacterium]
MPRGARVGRVRDGRPDLRELDAAHGAVRTALFGSRLGPGNVEPGRVGGDGASGGAFRYVSCPNYLGELLEWFGWALATWSLGGLAFFTYTAANLVPRALSHHRWYRERFADYPAGRKAVIPGVL